MKSGSYLSCVTFRRSSTFKNSSNCERLTELARQRIANLTARTKSVINLLCEDTAQLLQLGLHEKALLRAEQLYEDQHRLSAYAKIDDLCAAMLTDFDIISNQGELPAELKVVVCTLIFAASRYGELPELNKIRNLFREWWGDELISTNVNLLPGNLVDPQMKEILIINPLLDDAKKLELLSGIAENHNIISGFGSNEQNFKSESEEEKHESDAHSPYPQGTADYSSSPFTYKNIKMKMASYDESSSSAPSSQGSIHGRVEEIVYLDNNRRLNSPPPPYQIHTKPERIKLY